MDKVVKVKRLYNACCGMENGKIYTAKTNGHYVNVLLPDGTWTGDHWGGFGTDKPFFEIIK